MNAPLGLKILFVEDNDEIREALVCLLEDEGYEVVSATSAEDGMAALKSQGPFHLLVTDYALPGESGAWLVEQGIDLKLLHPDRVMMVTAHPNPRAPAGLKVIRKPLDLDDFLREVYDALAPARAAELEKARARIDAEPRRLNAIAQPPVELVLYISSSSPSSLKALRNVERLLADYDPAMVRLAVRDLSRERVETVEEDRVAFTPTLVKRSPLPRAWVLGDLENASVLEDLLAISGVERKRKPSQAKGQ